MNERLGKINYVTGNAGKVTSAQRILNPYGIEVIQAKLKLIEPQYDSLEQIVASKVEQAYQQLSEPCIAQDSGLMIDAWSGFPGAYTEYVQRTLGNEGLLKLMTGVPVRQAKFVRCLAYMGPNMDIPIFFHSFNPGIISDEVRGMVKDFHWSKLTLIFIPNGSKKTLAEMPLEEYHDVVKKQGRISAEEQFAQWFTKKVST